MVIEVVAMRDGGMVVGDDVGIMVGGVLSKASLLPLEDWTPFAACRLPDAKSQ